MPHDKNELGQPIGFTVPRWKPPQPPVRAPMEGQYCRLEPLDAKSHAEALHAANVLNTDGAMWTYMAYGPFDTLEIYRQWVDGVAGGNDPMFFAIVDRATGKPVGVASYLRIDPANGCIEVGHLAYSPLLQRRPAASEAMYLMMEQAFRLGYRRYEWKCDSLNAPSRRAALRYGFVYEGTFRQNMIAKGRNRDNAWFSMLDSEWPVRKLNFERWLAPENFDNEGRQKTSLAALNGQKA